MQYYSYVNRFVAPCGNFGDFIRKIRINHRSPMLTEKFQFGISPFRHYPFTLRLGFLGLHWGQVLEYSNIHLRAVLSETTSFVCICVYNWKCCKNVCNNGNIRKYASDADYVLYFLHTTTYRLPLWSWWSLNTLKSKYTDKCMF